MLRWGERLSSTYNNIDWVLLFSVFLILGAGLLTMNSFVGQDTFFEKQLVWIAISLIVFFAASLGDYRFLRKTWVSVVLFLGSILALGLLLLFAQATKGAQSWYYFGLFSVQPSDPVKLALIIILAKYFSRRHIEIAHIRHILVSGFYAGVLFLLVFIQPDFGSAIILFLIWLGMVLVSGISKRHLLAVFLAGAVAFIVLWFFVFAPYQKARILTFLNPLTDAQGAGYNALQSTIAVGSGQLFGKGVGFGTQSRLQFLPEYQTDFIFAAFAEEWGFMGSLVLFLLYAVVVWRIVAISLKGASNFEIFFGLGVAILFMSHFLVHVGMNIGLLPVTGTTIPFMSYGGSHLITEFLALGLLMGMRKYSRAVHKDDTYREFVGLESVEVLQ